MVAAAAAISIQPTIRVAMLLDGQAKTSTTYNIHTQKFLMPLSERIVCFVLFHFHFVLYLLFSSPRTIRTHINIFSDTLSHRKTQIHKYRWKCNRKNVYYSKNEQDEGVGWGCIVYEPLLLIVLDSHFRVCDGNQVSPVPLSHNHKCIRLLMHILSAIRYATILMSHAVRYTPTQWPMW